MHMVKLAKDRAKIVKERATTKACKQNNRDLSRERVTIIHDRARTKAPAKKTACGIKGRVIVRERATIMEYGKIDPRQQMIKPPL